MLCYVSDSGRCLNNVGVYVGGRVCVDGGKEILVLHVLLFFGCCALLFSYVVCKLEGVV